MPTDEEELKRAYALVHRDLQKLDVFKVYLFGDGGVELATDWETEVAAFGDDLYDAVQNLKTDNKNV